MAEPAPALRREVGFGLLTAYGLGVMVGAGIYVLVGVIAGLVGVWAPLAFALAALIAAPTALSYAELSARIPQAGGEVAYLDRAFGRRWLAVLVGLGIVASGTVSAAAVLRGGVGYLSTLVPLDPTVLSLAVGGGLTLVAARGVRESLGFAALLAMIEIGGLLMVIAAGFLAEPSPDWQAPAAVAEVAPGALAAATLLAFFAFIGFEDMVNMAEETRDPTRTVPRAVIAALALTCLLYMLVAVAAVRAVPVATLAASEQPLALVWQAGTRFGPGVLAAIAVAAALNGVLAQIVMAARVLLGIGRRVPALSALAAIDPWFGTPLRATLVLGAALVLGALLLPVATLAGATSVILLLVFTAINLALLRLKARAPAVGFSVPVWVPVLGASVSLAALGAAAWGLG